MDAPLTIHPTSSEMEDDRNTTSRESGNHSLRASLSDLASQSAQTMRIALIGYSLLFVVALYMVSTTLYEHPLFPIQPDSLEWNNAWLVATVFDYYGACLCFCGIVLSSEPSWLTGMAWMAGFLLLGSPVCCAWVILRIQRGGSLRLEDFRG